jgi:hypothetical protein
VLRARSLDVLKIRKRRESMQDSVIALALQGVFVPATDVSRFRLTGSVDSAETTDPPSSFMAFVLSAFRTLLIRISVFVQYLLGSLQCSRLDSFVEANHARNEVVTRTSSSHRQQPCSSSRVSSSWLPSLASTSLLPPALFRPPSELASQR